MQQEKKFVAARHDVQQQATNFALFYLSKNVELISPLSGKSLLTGTRIDHTRKSIYGHYIFADGIGKEEGDYSILRSPIVDLTRKPRYCIKV